MSKITKLNIENRTVKSTVAKAIHKDKFDVELKLERLDKSTAKLILDFVLENAK